MLSCRFYSTGNWNVVQDGNFHFRTGWKERIYCLTENTTFQVCISENGVFCQMEVRLKMNYVHISTIHATSNGIVTKYSTKNTKIKYDLVNRRTEFLIFQSTILLAILFKTDCMHLWNKKKLHHIFMRITVLYVKFIFQCGHWCPTLHEFSPPPP